MKLFMMKTAFILNVLFSICHYRNFAKQFYIGIYKEKEFLLLNKAKYKLNFYINTLINIFYKNSQKYFSIGNF
ncbi:hypothetical protein [Campylobacter concisus]|uniref:hypothetical protein n=1 Tax=Campylobacter concisus TaxID=199 RepID=UPI000CD7F425|nr:hypothetical protein [Campylobacter concisus]